MWDRREQKEGAKLITQEVPAPGRAAILLFEADVPQVSVIDADDAVVLPEEALLLGLAAPLQTLDQQAKSPETFRDECQRGRRAAPVGSDGARSGRRAEHPGSLGRSWTCRTSDLFPALRVV